MASSKFDILSIGDCSVDYFVVPEKFSIKKNKLTFDLAQKIPVKTLALFPGGNALNTAITFRNLGLRTGIITELGKDPEADIILKRIKAKHIDSRFVGRHNGEQTNRSIVIVTQGERTILSYHCEKEYGLPANLPSNWVYLTSLGANFGQIYKKLSNNKKIKLAYNPGSQQLMHDLASVRQMIKSCEVLYVNLEECRKILKTSQKDPKRLLSGLRKLGAGKVFITNGSAGGFAYDGQAYLKIGVYPAKRMDATGAGDAFASAATAAIVMGKSTNEALRWGSVMAAYEVSEVGVQNGLINRAALEKVLNKNAGFKAKHF